ncbi:endopeptidase La [Haloimpatiens lingqiaonensis]|uniref:endopeptidase La n=1 Tax=Haloimpatiens lingqiaonensis TaxID=1380675 RepID=UPI0010FE300E|nr:endopeptidase La [Haloimpatiens lingqiaonensis]
MTDNIKTLPLIPLRGIVIFPEMIIHFDVGRSKSILALEEAMLKEQKVFLVAQKEAKIEEPDREDINLVGTVCNIKQILRLPGDTVRVLVEGENRAKIIKYNKEEPYFEVDIEVLEEENMEDKKIQALTRKVKKVFSEYVRLSEIIPMEAIINLEDMENSGELADIILSYVPLKQNKKQELLETYELTKRLEKLLYVLNNELEIAKIENKIGTKVKNNIDKVQKEYYLKEQLKAIQEELGEEDDINKDIEAYKRKITKMKLPKEAKEKVMYELKKLERNGNYSPESNVVRTYLDWVLDLPWNKKTNDTIDIKKAREILDKEHYGLNEVKDRIIEYLAVKKVSNSIKGPILCLVGPPGVGKTSIAKSVAHAVNRNFVRMSLGGVRDEAEIRGHRRTYVGAIPGRIIYGMKKAKSKNPLFLLDEIDKMSNDFRGDPADALLEVLDDEQNSTFRDHYLELDFDLSNVLFITTANRLDTIPRPLLDRMEIIEVSGYTSEEKYHIATNHLIKKALEEHNIKDKTITFSDSAIYTIIENYTRESGVRELERKISAMVRKAITEMLEKNKEKINITSTIVSKYLGPQIYTYDTAEKEDKIGVVKGLAWTGYGGDTLPVEVSVMEGNGKLQLTGQLGDVMVESAKTAYSYVRANAALYHIDGSFYKDKDLHIHVPEGAVPKDGPSAGVTMATAIVSALSGKKVKHNVAMTGEITLTGRVLPIGGLKEKSLAAYRAGINTVIIPKENEKDINKIPKSVQKKLKFIAVDKIQQVLENALVGEMNNGN